MLFRAYSVLDDKPGPKLETLAQGGPNRKTSGSGANECKIAGPLMTCLADLFRAAICADVVFRGFVLSEVRPGSGALPALRAAVADPEFFDLLS
jgi:hypothetical protein